MIKGTLVVAVFCTVMGYVGSSSAGQSSLGSADKATLELTDAAYMRMDLRSTIDILTRVTTDTHASVEDKEKAFTHI